MAPLIGASRADQLAQTLAAEAMTLDGDVQAALEKRLARIGWEMQRYSGTRSAHNECRSQFADFGQRPYPRLL
ncbi:hypothetical protein [Paraburkholderia mimosarum]|uniref:hypothetical protein n=1 Tax=Paraburkholderia mimosarum TaxID=312026 RepID=UPI0012DEFB37|nr:hypothetical protein [Paraburkholderia mimosarum]